MARTPNLTRAALLTVLSMLCFASMDAATKFTVRSYPFSQILWVRYIMFTGIALAVAWPHGIRRSLRSAAPWLQAARALMGIVENWVFILAFAYLPLADAHAIAAVSPLLVIGLAAMMLRERAGLHRSLAVTAGLAGILVILRPSVRAFDWPLLIPFGGAILWALYQVLVRLCGRYDPSETTLLWTALAGAVLLSFIAPAAWRPPDASAWLLLLVIGALGSLGNFALIRALDYAEAGAVQPYSYFLLVFATGWGFAVFGDVPDRWTILGAAIVVASGLYAWHLDRRG